MNIFESLILGIVEGVTEFLPISSTFHLIFTSQLLGLANTDFLKMFEVAIQGGAIAALLFIYGKELLQERALATRVLVSFIPTAVVGTLLYSVIKGVFFGNNALIISVFATVGLLFLLIEKMVSTGKLHLSKKVSEITQSDALKIGLAQSLAVVPGVSRSGAVIIAMMQMGYKRAEAAKYTFLLSIPTILSASAYDLYKNRTLLATMGQDLMPLLVGMATAFVVAYIVMRWLITYLSTHTLAFFAWYRLVVAGLLVLYLYY